MCGAHSPLRARRGAGSLVPQLPKDAGVVGPGLADLDPGAKVDLSSEELLHVLARRARHALQALSAGADDDRLLAVALDEDGGLDAPQPPFFLEAVDHHVAAIRQLLAHRLEQLLAQELRGEETLVAVGELVRRIRR